MWGHGRQRDERGATAIMMALLSTVVFMVGAVAVDMGQVYAKRSALQSNVDMAAMAAASELTQETGCNAEVVTKAEEFLLKDTNEVHGQIALSLQDGNETNGEISCPGNWRVRLLAPRATVDFGMARIFEGEESLDVPASATAQIKGSPIDHLPMYAVAGCDSGHQVISNPPPGPTPTSTPPALTPNGTAQVRSLVVTPSEIEEGATAPVPMTVTGQVKGLAAGTTGQVTFSDSAAGNNTDAGSATPLPTSSGWSDFTINLTTVPQSVLDGNGIWWVRLKVVSGAVVNYSPTAEAEPFTVGDLLFCNGVVSGNFGTLRIARNDGNHSTWVEQNIVQGMQPSFAINPSSAAPCSPVDSASAPVSPTDCVGTDPGFPNEAATDGFVGSASEPGRLNADTTPGCDRNHGSSRTSTAPALNDDLLSCFLINGASVGDAVAGTPGVLSADIMTSPRFFMLPIIAVAASNGASGSYPIVGFRPAFITQEALTATRANPGTINGHNGVGFQSNHVESVSVVMFDIAALPKTAPARGGEPDYTGEGMKVVTLVE